MTKTRAAFLAAAVMGFAVLGMSASNAQTVPVPTPAPQQKTGQLRPQGSVPSASAQNNSKPEIIGNKDNPAGGFDAKQRALADRISTYLSSVKTMVGDFVQVGPDGTKSQGQFYILKPGRVRFEYNPPNPIDITADGRQVSVRNRNLDTQDLFPLSQTPLRFLLSERIDLRRETNIVGVYADDIFATVIIEEKQPLIGTSRLMMMFDAKTLQLKQWTVTDAQGFDTTVAVSNLDPNTKPDPAIYTINTASKKY